MDRVRHFRARCPRGVQTPQLHEVKTATFTEMKNVHLEATIEIHEIKVLGDWAWMRNRLKVTVTPPNGKPVLRSGYTLTIFRKKTDGRWVIHRDANLLTTVSN